MNLNTTKALILSPQITEISDCIVDQLNKMDVVTEVIESIDKITTTILNSQFDLLILFFDDDDLEKLNGFFKKIDRETVFILGIGPTTKQNLDGLDYYFSKDEVSLESILPLLESVFAITKKIKTQSELSGMIIHDIRSPMQSILSYLELLESQVFGTLNGGQQKMLKNALRLQDRILDMIEELGEVMRFENKSFQLEKTEFKIKELVQEVIKALWIQADKKNIKFTISIADEMPEIFADRLALNRVLTNLLTNAIRYSPEKGVVRIECSLGHHTNRKVCQFKVTDSGPGIKKEDIDLIFDKYYRAYRLKSAKGFGLGLYVARLFVEEHGGTIGVYNNREGGATFHFYLPMEN